MSLNMIGGSVPLSSSISPPDWRSSFDSFCRSSYIEESKMYSETVCKEVGDKIMHLLKGKPSSLWERDPFCVWVKSMGFALTSYPMLGLKEVLCVPVTDPSAGSASWRRVAYIEEFYDIISKFHIVNGDHLSSVETHTEVSKHYAGVPQLAVEKYLQLCPGCHGSSSSPVETPVLREPKRDKSSGYFMKKGQVEVIDITDKPLGPFCYICLYIDTYSNYHILFPLSSPPSSPSSSLTSEVPFEEIAHSLRKYVFPYFGMPKSLSSSLGSGFIDDLLRETCLHWPDAVVVRNSCKKKSERGGERAGKLARRSKSLISELFERCRSNLQDISLTPSACSDLLLSLQYQLNISTRKSSQKCAYELAFNVRPHCVSQSPGLHPPDTPISSNSSEDEIEGGVRKWRWDPERLIMKSKRENDSSNTDMISFDRNSLFNDITPAVEMNRLIQKQTSSTNSQQKIQQMLNASSIQAQEQQVTSLRELLRQEESRLELLKKMRKPNESPSIVSKDLSSHERGSVVSTGVIRSGDAVITHNGSQGPISARLQQLVDSVAVDQLNSKYSSNKKKSAVTDINKSSSPEVITISDSPSPASPPALISTSTVPGVIHNPPSLSSGEKPDESLVMKTIENSRRYREFLVKQNTVKRTFQKQIDKRISSFPYPKTFRQVWPIIPVQDPSFVKNLGLETVTQFFDQPHPSKGSGSSGGTGASKVKPICNQCGCDFASAWQIRKNNSKQVLLCEACDFTNLKLLQRTKLTAQLKEIIEGVKREEDKFNSETEDARKQLIAVERVGVISNSQKSGTQPTSHVSSHVNHVISSSGGGIRHQSLTERVADAMIPSIIGGKGGRTSIGTAGGGGRGGKGSSHTEKTKSPLEISRKRKVEQQEASHSGPASKSPKTHLDLTLNRITQQLLMKQVDEKVHKRRRKDTSSPGKNRQGRSPPPLQAANHTPHEEKSAPPPLMSATPSNVGGDSRRNRRKGQPKQNIKT